MKNRCPAARYFITGFKAKAKALAEILQKRFSYVPENRTGDFRRQNGNYYLLLHVKCPIVIVECGFLRQPKGSRTLNSGEYQDKLAYTIHMGVAEYLNGENDQGKLHKIVKY